MSRQLQQYLPFTVLKQRALMHLVISLKVATVLTVYGIETLAAGIVLKDKSSCNSTYRLRY